MGCSMRRWDIDGLGNTGSRKQSTNPFLAGEERQRETENE